MDACQWVLLSFEQIQSVNHKTCVLFSSCMVSSFGKKLSVHVKLNHLLHVNNVIFFFYSFFFRFQYVLIKVLVSAKFHPQSNN